MIVIDTNVVSELMRTAPDEGVLDWFGRRDADDLYISAVTEAELRRGVAILLEGRRRDALASAIDAMVAEDFTGRVLAFDGPAAIAFAAVFAERRAIGPTHRLSRLPDRGHGSCPGRCGGDAQRRGLRRVRDRCREPLARGAGPMTDVDKPNVPIALIEAKDNRHGIGDGMQQALGYASRAIPRERRRVRDRARAADVPCSSASR